MHTFKMHVLFLDIKEYTGVSAVQFMCLTCRVIIFWGYIFGNQHEYKKYHASDTAYFMTHLQYSADVAGMPAWLPTAATAF